MFKKDIKNLIGSLKPNKKDIEFLSNIDVYNRSLVNEIQFEKYKERENVLETRQENIPISEISKKEKDLTDKFWIEFSEKNNLEDKIELLKEYADIKIGYSYNYAKKRGITCPAKTTELCEVCGEFKAQYKHHIIELVNGGSNRFKNKIGICNRCHNLVHTWMKKQRSKIKLKQGKRFERMCNNIDKLRYSKKDLKERRVQNYKSYGFMKQAVFSF